MAANGASKNWRRIISDVRASCAIPTYPTTSPITSRGSFEQTFHSSMCRSVQRSSLLCTRHGRTRSSSSRIHCPETIVYFSCTESLGCQCEGVGVVTRQLSPSTSRDLRVRRRRSGGSPASRCSSRRWSVDNSDPKSGKPRPLNTFRFIERRRRDGMILRAKESKAPSPARSSDERLEEMIVDLMREQFVSRWGQRRRTERPLTQRIRKEGPLHRAVPWDRYAS